MSERIYLELRFPAKGMKPQHWQRMQGHYMSPDHARNDKDQINRNWRGRKGAPDGHRIIRVTEEIIEEVTE